MTTRTFIIDRSTWVAGGTQIRGNNAIGRGTPALLNDEGFLCCLGQIARQCGFTKKQLHNNLMPSDAVQYSRTKPSGFLTEIENDHVTDTELAHLAQEINDHSGLTQHEREQELAALFAKHNYRLRFINRPVPCSDV